MYAQAKTTYITPAEYLAREREAEFRSEYFDGEVFAMAGTSELHNLIVPNIVAELHTQLKRRPCKVYSNDLRLKVSRSGLYTYPDVMVVCGKPRLEDEHLDVLLNPTLIVEVLSPSTEHYDRVKKFEHYRKLDSFAEYLLVAQDRPRVEQYVKQPDGKWLYADAYHLEDVIELTSIECKLALQDVYAKVEWKES